MRSDQRTPVDRTCSEAHVANTAHASADIEPSDGTGEITGAGTPSQRADKAEIGSGLIQVEIPDLLAVRIEITADVGNVEAGCAAQADVPAKLELETSAVGIAQIVLQVLSRGETVKAIRIRSPKHGCGRCAVEAVEASIGIPGLELAAEQAANCHYAVKRCGCSGRRGCIRGDSDRRGIAAGG